jgi:hypothetical protein
LSKKICPSKYKDNITLQNALNELRENIYKKKKHPKLPAVYNLALQCSKSNKVAPKLPKCNKKATYFLYSYNTPIFLTNKIIVKKTILKKYKKKKVFWNK